MSLILFLCNPLSHMTPFLFVEVHFSKELLCIHKYLFCRKIINHLTNLEVTPDMQPDFDK